MLESKLRTNGHASLGTVFTPAQCDEISALFPQDAPFRTRIQMARYRFGSGEYAYFAYPLPPAIQQLRETLYSQLAPLAQRWMQDLRTPVDYPDQLPDFLAQCHAANQTRPTPLLLRYQPGDYNCLHQDLYGNVVFPFQVIVGLSTNYTGGELLLVEQRPRAQTIARVIPLNQGEAVVIATRHKPVQGTRGFYRANVKHGVSELRSGTRFTLGIIFHDSE